MPTPTPPLPKKDRLRRVVLLCVAFTRNLAYYRVGQEEFRHLLNPQENAGANFWRVANNNFIDMCVLEWCKLFGDKDGKHYWANVVADPAAFKTALLKHLGVDEDEFQEYVREMRHYRDKFLAHLDSENVMNIPVLEVAMKAVRFYHAHVATCEAREGDMAGLPLDLDSGYEQSAREARAVFDQ